MVDFPLFISINTGKTSDFKDYIDPVKQKITEYKNADLATKLRLNKEYAINEVLPVLTAYEVNTEAKFEGVVNFGKLIEKTNFNEIQNIDELTSKNKNYWRAVMEMSAGNQLIPITKIFALVSQGELDYAKKYIEIIRIFTDPQTISNKYLEEINSRINLFNEDLYKKIQRGIEEHDEGEYQRAINIYNEILSVYPNSSWTLYEKYYSENTKKLPTKQSIHLIVKTGIKQKLRYTNTTLYITWILEPAMDKKHIYYLDGKKSTIYLKKRKFAKRRI